MPDAAADDGARVLLLRPRPHRTEPRPLQEATVIDLRDPAVAEDVAMSLADDLADRIARERQTVRALREYLQTIARDQPSGGAELR